MKKVLIGILIAFSLLFCLVSCSKQSSEAAKSVSQVNSDLPESAADSSNANGTAADSASDGQAQSAAGQTSKTDAAITESEKTSTLNIPTEETLKEEENTDSTSADSMTKEDIQAHMRADGRYYNSSKYYSFTPIPDTEVNQFAEDVQFAFLEDSWWDLAEKIQFPITIQGVQYKNQNEFTNHSWSSVFDDDWLIGLMDESCYYMQVENDSIRMADGRVIIINVFESDGTPKLLVKSINV